MSTRGIYGFILNEKIYSVYNHYDSYPRCLGANIIKYIYLIEDWEKLKNNVKKLVNKDIEKKDDYSQGKWIFSVYNGLDNEYNHYKFNNYTDYAYLLNLDKMCIDFYMEDDVNKIPLKSIDINSIFSNFNLLDRYCGNFKNFDVRVIYNIYEDIITIYGQEHHIHIPSIIKSFNKLVENGFYVGLLDFSNVKFYDDIDLRDLNISNLLFDKSLFGKISSPINCTIEYV